MKLEDFRSANEMRTCDHDFTEHSEDLLFQTLVFPSKFFRVNSQGNSGHRFFGDNKQDGILRPSLRIGLVVFKL